MLSRKSWKRFGHYSFLLFFRGKISSFYEREVTIMTMYILALTAVTALLIQMDWMQYRDRRDNND